MRAIKVGGRVQGDPGLAAALARAWVDSPRALCVVHGGGDAVTALQRALGGEPRFVGGRRVTSEEDVELVRMAVSGAANKQLVSRLRSLGVDAVGVSGEDGGLLDARVIDGGAIGRAGMPVSANGALIRHLLSGGFLPVVSPVGRDVDRLDGAALNVNGDDAAAAIAAALGAPELLLVSDVEGVMIDGMPARELDAAEATRAVESGAASGGMAAKLAAAASALAAGVERVRIGGVSMLRDERAGTLLRAMEVTA